jgi:hypothetical protein
VRWAEVRSKTKEQGTMKRTAAAVPTPTKPHGF